MKSIGLMNLVVWELIYAYPLRRRSTAVHAFVVLIRLGDRQEFGASLRIDLPHLRAHVGGIARTIPVDRSIFLIVLSSHR